MVIKKNKKELYFERKSHLLKLVGLMLENGKTLQSRKRLDFFLGELKGYRQIRNKPFELINPVLIFSQQVKPSLGLKNKKVAGKRYKVPYAIESKRALRFSLKWFGDELKLRINSRSIRNFSFKNSFFSLVELDGMFRNDQTFLYDYLQRYNEGILEHRSSVRFI